MIGTRVGVYEVAGKLGAGAMGEVYRGRDTRLGREVAIKVLPAAFTQDPERLGRFEREAKLLASLNHPNIATIYGLEESNGAQALVMELIDGEDLGKRIARGPLPWSEALDIARQIASALDAAHERGVIHRDLKPANVLITPEGQAKVLDFGLAKSDPASASSGSGMSMTATSAGTVAGMILGTAAYMSPEQARGKAVDRRTDVWAFGCVVYEMLTGKAAFAGETVTDVLAAIVHEDPDWSALPAAARPRLERLLRRCLAKDVRERMSDLGDAALILKEIAAEKPTAQVAPIAAKSSKSWIAAAILAAIGLAAGFGAGRRTGNVAPTTASAAPVSFKQLTFVPGGEGEPAISPDGQSFAYVAGPMGHGDIFVQRIDGRNAVNVTASCTEDDGEPAFSPDGRLIAYVSKCNGGGLFVMGATGESSRKLADGVFSPAWSPDGKEIAAVTEQPTMPWARETTSTLFAIDVETGKRRKVSDHDAMQPSWSADGKHIAFWGLVRDSAQRDLFVVAADGGASAKDAAVNVTNDAALDWSPVWAPDGRHLYFTSTRGGTFNVWRIPVDPANGTATGPPVPFTAPSSWAGWLSVSKDGKRLLYVDRNARTAIVRAPFDASRAQLAGAPVEVPLGTMEIGDGIDLSPHGDKILFSNQGFPQHLFLVHADGSGLVQLTDGSYRERQGAFSPDGSWIAFQTNRFPQSLALIRPDGSNMHAVPSTRTESCWFPYWSPDGKRVVVSSQKGAFLVDPMAETNTVPWTAMGNPSQENFWATSFFPGGDRLLGILQSGSGEAVGVAVRSVSGGRQTPVPGDYAGIGQPRVLPDGKRFVFDTGHRLSIGSIDGSQHDLYSPPPGRLAFALAISHDQRWIAWTEFADESDVWMATIGE